MRCDSDPASHTPTDFGAQRRAILAGLGGLAAGAAFATTASAGTLTPPGAPAGTMKRLDEVEPRIAINSSNTRGDIDSVFRITQPGSYYLTGNVTGQSGKHGIQIAASNVSIDLMGFTLQGVAGSLSGVHCDGQRDHLAIVNGVITGWGGLGIDMQNAGFTGRGATLERLLIAANGSTGVYAHPSAVIRDCIARANGGAGIYVLTEGIVTHCVAEENGGAGIVLAAGSSAAVACIASRNGNLGIAGSVGSMVIDCVANFNDLHGVQVSGESLVRACVCRANGQSGDGAGILVSGDDNRIEDNLCNDNDRGIRAVNAGNVLLRNTCAGNTTLNWDVVAGNCCLVVAAVAAGAIAGNSGGASLGTTDPWANFSF